MHAPSKQQSDSTLENALPPELTHAERRSCGIGPGQGALVRRRPHPDAAGKTPDIAGKQRRDKEVQVSARFASCSLLSNRLRMFFGIRMFSRRCRIAFLLAYAHAR